jgi:hypothetical protein
VVVSGSQKVVLPPVPLPPPPLLVVVVVVEPLPPPLLVVDDVPVLPLLAVEEMVVLAPKSCVSSDADPQPARSAAATIAKKATAFKMRFLTVIPFRRTAE